MFSVSLKPTPGYCLKSTTLQPSPHGVPAGTKIFVNLAWDKAVPAPPDSDEQVIAHAMQGVDKTDNSSGGDGVSWYVPVVVSEPRPDTDKAGKPCLVFDCVVHSGLKSRATKDFAFRDFLFELSLQRVEASASLALARPYSRPNIRSKGTLEPRTVHLPAVPGSSEQKKPLIQEVTESKGILKNKNKNAIEEPQWTCTVEGADVVFRVRVPKLSHTAIPQTTLDLEPRRFLFTAPQLYALDLDLSTASPETRNLRPLKIDDARAEWHVAQGQLIVFA